MIFCQYSVLYIFLYVFKHYVCNALTQNLRGIMGLSVV